MFETLPRCRFSLVMRLFRVECMCQSRLRCLCKYILKHSIRAREGDSKHMQRAVGESGGTACAIWHWKKAHNSTTDRRERYRASWLYFRVVWTLRRVGDDRCAAARRVSRGKREERGKREAYWVYVHTATAKMWRKIEMNGKIQHTVHWRWARVKLFSIELSSRRCNVFSLSSS